MLHHLPKKNKFAQTIKKVKNFILVSSQIVPTKWGRTWTQIPEEGGYGRGRRSEIHGPNTKAEGGREEDTRPLNIKMHLV